MTPADPARIHLLPAARAPVVIVIRRKPAKLFHIIRVDTDTGKAEHGEEARPRKPGAVPVGRKIPRGR